MTKENYLKRLFALLCFLSISISQSLATTYTTVSNGNWTSPSIWDANGSPGTYWGDADVVVVAHDVHLNQNIGFGGTLKILSTASLIGSNKDLSVYSDGKVEAQGILEVDNYTLNGNTSSNHYSTVTVNGNLTVGSNSNAIFNSSLHIEGSLLNNGAKITLNSSLNIEGHLQNNNGQLILNGTATVQGNLSNNNSEAVIYVNKALTVYGNIKNNNGAKIYIDNTAVLNLNGNFENNTSSTINIDGRLNISGNMENNGGTVNANGIVDVSGNLTLNSGVYYDDGITMVEGSTIVNGSGSMQGEGLLRTNDLINYGSIAGTIDICNLDDTAIPSQNGGGNYDPTLTYCNQSLTVALPIELNYFKGKAENGNVLFKWQTLSELNNEQFNIEYSKNGEVFIKVAEIKGSGTSNKVNTYNYTYQTSSYQVNGYYRLRQTDFDGKSKHFAPIYIESSTLADHINAYPNPANNQLFVEFDGVEKGEYSLALHNASGSIVRSEIIYIDGETLYFETEIIHQANLKKGFYFLRISSNKERYFEKIIVN